VRVVRLELAEVVVYAFAGATLTGANMSNATVDDGTSFVGAVYDRSTVWPPGVNQTRCRRGVCEASH
jgi:hypothetical protein